MSFILGILIVGALLSFIFGKQIGALFCTGVFTVAIIFMGLAAACFLGILIWGGYFSSGSSAKTTSSSDYNSTYGTRYGTAPAYGSSAQTYAPATTTQTYTPAAQMPTPTYQMASPSSFSSSPSPGGPTVGVVTNPADVRLSAQFGMAPGYGAIVVSVDPGGPAAQAGLLSGDFVQAMDADPLTANHTLTDYAARKGVGQPITLSIQHNDGSGWAHRWVKVYPR